MKNAKLKILFLVLGSYILVGCKYKKKVRNDGSSWNLDNHSMADSLLLDSSLHIEPQFTFDPIPKEIKDNFFNKRLSSNLLVDSDYWTWGASVIKWSDGKYHAYYSRWKYDTGFQGWLTDCEIVHGVSDKPEGPYHFVNVVLESRNPSGWESATAHNPSIVVANGKIYLYYISTELEDFYKSSKTISPISQWMRNNWNIARNNQRIGMAVAANPNGPFERIKTPVVAPDGVTFKNIAVNPAVAFANNTFTMIMKGDDIKHEAVFRIQLVGFSDKAEGPFEFKEEPVYDKMQTEDATIWYDKSNDTYFMACHVLSKPELMLMTSKNGQQWKPTANPLFTKKEITLDNGEIWKPERVERPFVLTDAEGQPMMLFVSIKDREISGNIAIPINRSQNN